MIPSSTSLASAGSRRCTVASSFVAVASCNASGMVAQRVERQRAGRPPPAGVGQIRTRHQCDRRTVPATAQADLAHRVQGLLRSQGVAARRRERTPAPDAGSWPPGGTRSGAASDGPRPRSSPRQDLLASRRRRLPAPRRTPAPTSGGPPSRCAWRRRGRPWRHRGHRPRGRPSPAGRMPDARCQADPVLQSLCAASPKQRRAPSRLERCGEVQPFRDVDRPAAGLVGRRADRRSRPGGQLQAALRLEATEAAFGGDAEQRRPERVERCLRRLGEREDPILHDFRRPAPGERQEAAGGEHERRRHDLLVAGLRWPRRRPGGGRRRS